jgi:HEAT repeat protein
MRGAWRTMLCVVAAICFAWTTASTAAGDDEAEPKLKGKPLSKWIEQLNHTNRGLQVRAARALSEAPKELRSKIIPRLIPLLGHKRENLLCWVAQVLGSYGPEARAAVPGLLPLLEGTQFERNRAAAAKALGLILKDATPGEEVEKVAVGLSEKYNEEYDKYSDVRREAVRAVGMIGPAAKKVIPKLHRALIDYRKYSREHEMVRQQAAWACGRMGPLAKMHIDRLISMLHQEGHKLPEIAWAIGQIGPVHENVVPNLVDKMEKSMNYGGLVMRSLEALENFGEKSAPAVDFLMYYMKSGRASAEAFIQTLKTLKAIGPKAKKAVPLVTKYKDIKSYSAHHRRASAEQVAMIRKLAAEFLESVNS